MITFSKIGNYGRLGNQLFQIATTLALAEENNDEAKFLKWEYAKFFKNPIDQSLNHSEKIQLHKYTEPAFHYTKIPYRENLDLHGYFQSEKYFKDYSDLIKHHFTFIDGLIPKKLVKQASECCSIHIRRGDYVNLAAYHPFPGKEYYIKAMELIKNDVSKFMVFSDDIPWCKALFGNNPNIIYIENQTNVQDMYLMSQCKHNIIANSSFSWWGAYLNNNNNNKQVIAPLNWFGPANNANTQDLYCEGWKIM